MSPNCQGKKVGSGFVHTGAGEGEKNCGYLKGKRGKKKPAVQRFATDRRK